MSADERTPKIANAKQILWVDLALDYNWFNKVWADSALHVEIYLSIWITWRAIDITNINYSSTYVFEIMKKKIFLGDCSYLCGFIATSIGCSIKQVFYIIWPVTI